MRFYKYHALGNDYLVLNPADFPQWARSESGAPPAEQVRRLCHRHYGIGSDGILWGPLPAQRSGGEDGQSPLDVGAAARAAGLGADSLHPAPPALRIFNPDGSEAEKSGNGLRIFARYLAEYGLVGGERFAIQTAGGLSAVQIIDRATWQLKIGMGAVSFSSPQIPVTGPAREVINETLHLGAHTSYRFCAATVGNPHCVIPLPEISAALAREHGPAIETHALFPNKINVQFMQVLDRANIRIEIWERGAGYTLASGSSSSAAAAVAHRLGLVDTRLTVHMPGGQLAIEISPDWQIDLTGPVTRVSEGQASPDLFNFPDRV